MDVSHRQRKKATTRAALITSAFVLFSERGYDKTTIADIAAHANCAPRTFFLYFKSKEELLPAFMEQLSEDLAARFAVRNPQTTTLQVLREWILEMLALHPVPSDSQNTIHRDASFEGRKYFYLTTFVRPILSAAFAEDLHTDVDALEPRLLATEAVALLNEFDFSQSTVHRELYIDMIITLLAQSVESLQHK